MELSEYCQNRFVLSHTLDVNSGDVHSRSFSRWFIQFSGGLVQCIGALVEIDFTLIAGGNSFVQSLKVEEQGFVLSCVFFACFLDH